MVAQFGPPRVANTDKLRSYAPNAEHRPHKGLNNAIEVSHPHCPAGFCEANAERDPPESVKKYSRRFKSQRQSQRFLSADEPINLIFRPDDYKVTSISYRHAQADAFSLWKDYTIEMAA